MNSLLSLETADINIAFSFPGRDPLILDVVELDIMLATSYSATKELEYIIHFRDALRDKYNAPFTTADAMRIAEAIPKAMDSLKKSSSPSSESPEPSTLIPEQSPEGTYTSSPSSAQ